MALVHSDLPDLPLVSKGKVRDIYALPPSPEHLLFVASDRISAYDVILNNGIPAKGKLLTQISLFWFRKLAHIIPNHFVTADVDAMPEGVRKYKDQLDGRAMLVKKAKVVPLEAIVRGYISGSAWAEYKKSGTVHADQGAHDENISAEQAAKLVGQDLYDRISRAAIALYKTAADYAATRGVILADTKFEFGLIPGADGKDELILVDELLTPDSSRYWPADSYNPGGPQPSFDKQYLRDWLVSKGFEKGLESGPPGQEGQGWTIDEDVVEGTKKRYEEVVRLLVE
uniref:Phosphoribosylaminoimidazole-succinocarboxamide synthase n=1 Tax=Schizophyllum commune (strain H4-8 / FGSC 9210) TaxID=578458 RepID=D8Q108_SCHCM